MHTYTGTHDSSTASQGTLQFFPPTNPPIRKVTLGRKTKGSFSSIHNVTPFILDDKCMKVYLFLSYSHILHLLGPFPNTCILTWLIRSLFLSRIAFSPSPNLLRLIFTKLPGLGIKRTTIRVGLLWVISLCGHWPVSAGYTSSNADGVHRIKRQFQ